MALINPGKDIKDAVVAAVQTADLGKVATDAVDELKLPAVEQTALDNLDTQVKTILSAANIMLSTTVNAMLRSAIAQLTDELKGILVGRTITITIK